MQPTRFTSRVFARHVLALGLAAGLLAGCSLIGSDTPTAEIPQPISPQPRPEQLNPGLRPLYISGPVASVDAIPAGNAALSGGRLGPAVLQLDTESPGGRMWDSGFSEGYAIRLSGLIQLEAGIYGFAALSDDGVRITIGNTRVVDDPLMHVARLSPTTQVTIKEPGWYPITVEYFQVSGSAALRLYWHPPGAGGLLVAPAAILAHWP